MKYLFLIVCLFLLLLAISLIGIVSWNMVGFLHNFIGVIISCILLGAIVAIPFFWRIKKLRIKIFYKVLLSILSIAVFALILFLYLALTMF